MAPIQAVACRTELQLFIESSLILLEKRLHAGSNDPNPHVNDCKRVCSVLQVLFMAVCTKTRTDLTRFVPLWRKLIRLHRGDNFGARMTLAIGSPVAFRREKGRRRSLSFSSFPCQS